MTFKEEIEKEIAKALESYLKIYKEGWRNGRDDVLCAISLALKDSQGSLEIEILLDIIKCLKNLTHDD